MLTAVIVAADLIGASSVIGAGGLLWKLAGLCDVSGGLSGVVYSNSDSVCVDSVVHVSPHKQQNTDDTCMYHLYSVVCVVSF